MQYPDNDGDGAGGGLHDVHGQVLVCLMAGLVWLHIKIAWLPAELHMSAAAVVLYDGHITVPSVSTNFILSPVVL